jgi:hypothetical protein
MCWVLNKTLEELIMFAVIHFKAVVLLKQVYVSAYNEVTKDRLVQIGISGCEYEHLLISNKKESVSRTFEVNLYKMDSIYSLIYSVMR